MRYFQRTLVGLIFVAITHLAFAQAGDFETRKGVEYATHDGAKLAGDLYLPKAAGPHPAIVAIHGGGWQIGGALRDTHWGGRSATSTGDRISPAAAMASSPSAIASRSRDRRRFPRRCTMCAPPSSTSK